VQRKNSVIEIDPQNVVREERLAQIELAEEVLAYSTICKLPFRKGLVRSILRPRVLVTRLLVRQRRGRHRDAVRVVVVVFVVGKHCGRGGENRC
jgi:hypothetical protein